ncbi:EAL domain-containing protein [Phytohabitans sp. ZYX-F-186]|uniref:EAL domain-containing protein n=1 Tax=Phytohabitans maris TaxID=3071409 RepID=A0ABU0ZJR9_9ACTN|nr:EAL domain-containing protein [Phytohabitans sp. ZYX-F-186]MDQ7907305.1 EAL domain-containing protein [Phytohabitans sp. ZYX-F-186]
MREATIDQYSREGVRRYARLWARAGAALGYVPMSPDETERVLRDHTMLLAETLVAEPFVATPAYGVGRALVDAHFTVPEFLDQTLLTFGRRFLELVVPGSSGKHADRAVALQAALAAGYARGLRDRTFAQQERISRAVWSARNQAEQDLRASEARFRAVFAGAAIGIGIADLDGRIIDVNQAFADMLGYSLDEMREINVTELFYPDDAPGMWDTYKEMIEGKRDGARVEKRYFRKDRTILWTDLSVSLIRDEDGQPRFTVAMVEDITDRYELQERLRFQALHDPLTGLPNRTLFFERLAAVFDGAATRVGVCFLDLDGFKAVNDSLGHYVGDELLVVVARRLAASVSARGHLVARMGGDEFVILVEDSSGTDAAVAVAEAALAAVAEPVKIDSHQPLSVTASIGIVEREVRGTSPTDVMKAADTTLYWAKADGRGRWALFDPVRGAHQLARAALAAALPGALDRGEFTLEYQPIVGLTSGRLRAVEALVRWRHPELGTVPPDRFIGLAEETGMIVRLGRWVLEQACVQAARWHREFPDAGLVVSVNLAVRQANAPGIVEEVAGVLERTGLPARQLQLELTESAVMPTAGEPVRSLRGLADTGVRIAIDDFGTGYSNLAYLRRLPIHSLKLAGPFIEGLRSGDLADSASVADERIVDALVRLAHALGLTVTAEAVETAQQADLLRGLDCDTGQGLLFGGATSADDITARLRSTR